jgi:aspartate/glutamate racemase
MWSAIEDAGFVIQDTIMWLYGSGFPKGRAQLKPAFELICVAFKTEAVAYFQRVFARVKDAGCDAVVLGCTEIPLIMNDINSPLPTLDSTRLLARAALRRAVAE